MKVIRIKITETCNSCNGDGWKENLVYQMLAEENDTYHLKKNKMMTDDEKEEFFKRIGCEIWPPSKYACSMCEGTGRVEREVSVNELKEILNMEK